MRKVFGKNSDVMDLFLNRTQDEARCKNVFFEKDKIYSFGTHYELGRFLDPGTVLINDDGYSKTTKRHVIKLYFQAKSAGINTFFKSNIYPDRVVKSMKVSMARYKKARRPAIYKNSILERYGIFEEYDRYNTSLGPEHPEFIDWSKDQVDAFDEMVEIVRYVKGEDPKIETVKDDETSMKELQKLFNF